MRETHLWPTPSTRDILTAQTQVAMGISCKRPPLRDLVNSEWITHQTAICSQANITKAKSTQSTPPTTLSYKSITVAESAVSQPDKTTKDTAAQWSNLKDQ